MSHEEASEKLNFTTQESTKKYEEKPEEKNNKKNWFKFFLRIVPTTKE